MKSIHSSSLYKHTVFLSQCGNLVLPNKKSRSLCRSFSIDKEVQTVGPFGDPHISTQLNTPTKPFSHSNHRSLSSNTRSKAQRRNGCRSFCGIRKRTDFWVGSFSLTDSPISMQMNIQIHHTSEHNWSMLDLG